LKLIEVGAGATQTQKLRLCYRCSASLSIFDSDRRLADHFIGKMHVGFVKIREKLEELKAAGFGVTKSTSERGYDNRRRDRDSFRDRDRGGRRYDHGRRRSPPRGRNY
jgi:RNA-binding protein Luc7-like 2